MANFHPDYAGLGGRQVLTQEAFDALKPVFDSYKTGEYKGNAEAKLAEIAERYKEIKWPAYFAWWLVTVARTMEWEPLPQPLPKTEGLLTSQEDKDRVPRGWMRTGIGFDKR